MIILATSNIGKINEYKEIYPYFDYKVLDKKLDIDENGSTYLENAFIKASAVYQSLDKKLPVLSDDSGIEILALNNFPGIYSSRFANTISTNERNALVLEKLKNKKDRRARFVCVICLIDREGNKYYGKGIVNGTIATKIRGDKGFGYDPIFIPDGYDKTFGELGDEIKNTLSHRGNAFKDLLTKLPLKFMRYEKHD